MADTIAPVQRRGAGTGDYMKNANGVLLVLCALLGLVITLQFKSVTHNQSYESNTGEARTEKLAADYSNEKAKNELLKEQLAQVQEEVDKYREEAESSGGIQKTLSEQIQKLEFLAGLTRVKGKGIVITLNDSAAPNDLGISEDNFVIHHSDLLSIVNEMRGAGAEAIMINGQRVISTTEIYCTGSTISINRVPCSVPFVISAIGDPATLEGALRMRGGVYDVLVNTFGFKIGIEQKNDIIIEPYGAAYSFKYAVKVK